MAIALSSVINTNIVTAFMEEEIRKSLVFAPLVRVHMDDIAPGSSYKVPGVGDVTIRDYVGTAITTDDMSDIGTSIAIDKQKYFSFRSQDIDEAQAAIDYLTPYTERAVYSLSNALDVTIAEGLVSSAAKQVTSAGTVDASTVLTILKNVKYTMDVNNISQQNRFVVVPATVTAALVEKLGTGALNQSGEQALQAGFVTDIFGMKVYMSNNLKTAGTGFVTAVGGVVTASDLIYSINKFEVLRDPTTFSNINRGLLVYGYGVNNYSSIVNCKVAV